MEIKEVKEMCKTYGMSYASDYELIHMITGKKKIDQLTKEMLDEYVRRNTIRGVKVRKVTDILPYLKQYEFSNQEIFSVVILDGGHNVIAIKELFKGTVNKSIVHPRDLFRECVKENAAAFIIAHNHPSGDSYPSTDDRETTNRIKDAGMIMGIQLLDHIIIGKGEYYSFVEHDELGD